MLFQNFIISNVRFPLFQSQTSTISQSWPGRAYDSIAPVLHLLAATALWVGNERVCYLGMSGFGGAQ